MTVLVVGATGNVGRRVVDGLLAQGIAVRATTRSPEKATFPAGVEVFKADLMDPESFRPALQGVEKVFLYADIDEPAALVEVLKSSGVKYVVLLSSWSAAKPDAETNFNGARFYRFERALEASGMGWTFLRPGTFSSNAARWSWGIKGEGAVPLPYPESVTAPVHEQDIADLAVLALTSDALVGQAPILTGPKPMTLRQQVDDIGKAIGRDLGVAQQTDAEARASLNRYLPPGWADYLVDEWREAVTAPPTPSGEYTRFTGKPARPFSQWAEENADLFR